ncbi:helix-turn-helix transcriptional regulator [Labrys monachus]|uniref:AraC-like DNA-binding protein n=1 Tax=Labrys monachus TaxID=217067 RepID=A0ABU0FHZ1_9HYPH|nr:AraC family transcriptional regulator [Labrys monachus]MDQ0394223.1 AraC-like DNA-binding protein [Labrys monachus]
MVLVLGGRKILHSRGREVIIGTGEAVLIPDRLDFDVLNEPGGNGPYRALALGFAPELIGAAVAGETAALTQIRPLRDLPPGLADACDRAAEAIAAGDSLPDRVAAGRVHEVLLWLASLGHRFEAPAPSDLIDRLRKIIMADPARDWRAGDLASRVGASEPTLRRRLAAAGTSFTEILADIRMTAALYLLQSTDRPVTAIALDVGYDSASRFAARFKARFDFAPSEIRGHRRDIDRNGTKFKRPGAAGSPAG